MENTIEIMPKFYVCCGELEDIVAARSARMAAIIAFESLQLKNGADPSKEWKLDNMVHVDERGFRPPGSKVVNEDGTEKLAHARYRFETRGIMKEADFRKEI